MFLVIVKVCQLPLEVWVFVEGETEIDLPGIGVGVGVAVGVMVGVGGGVRQGELKEACVLARVAVQDGPPACTQNS